MPAERLKPLYKGRCLDDLKPLYDINVEVDPKRLYRSAPKIFEAAETARLKGDEEVSYVYYMKFLSAVQRVKQFKDARKDIYSGEIKKQQVVEALDHAEKLSTSLALRYEELKERRDKEAFVASKLKDTEVVEISSVTVVKPETEKFNGYADVSDEFVSCAKLYNLLDEKKKLLVLDVRSGSYFADSHLKSDCVINVPDTVVEAGMTSAKLERVLPVLSKYVWAQRGSVDLIVLLDWSTSVTNFKPESSIAILRDILLNWDTQFEYKYKPLILDGGYDEWLLRYPVCTTNPSPSIIPTVQNLPSSDFLSDIEYPNLSESLESVQPSVDRSSKPTSVYSSSSKSVPAASTFSTCVTPKPTKPFPSNALATVPSKSVLPTKGPSSTSLDQRPSVDRKSKAAALITYEERSQNVQALLRQEEEVVATTLQLEQDKQKIEEEREKTRLRREIEAEEEMRLQLQEREEQLLRDIQNLEKLQQEKDRENQALRDELAEYKKKEQEENLPKEYTVYRQQEEAIAERIRNSEEKRKKIVQDRERKIREEYQNQKKKLVMNEDTDHLKNSLTYEEREKQAREKLYQQRLHKERQRPGKVDDVSKEKGHPDVEESKENRSPLPSRSPVDLNRDKKLAESTNEQIHSFKNKVNGTYTTQLKDTPSGIMKRSRSSPNIAQLNDDDLNARGKPYKSNFAPDLRVGRQRNFSPVYGDLGRGLTGLKNLGNTCYMNTIIQCLSNTTPLAKYFVSGQYRNDINRQTETRGEIAEEVAAVVRALWSSNFKCIATRDLRSVVGKHRDQFQSSQQQDSNEFLTILMDWLHEDLKKPSIKLIGDTRRDQQDWEKQWDEFYKENTSLIVLLFYGQQKSTVKCLQCYKESVRYETFSNLTLPLPSNSSSCTLEDCVQLYVKGEHITGWKCPACKEQRDAMKKFDIIKLPPILIIHFKRFYIDGWCRKRQTFVQFPLTDWDMRKYTLLPEQKYTKYNLYGVSNHYGTMEGGHYTAYCKSIEHKKWYKFDDNEVSEISPGDVQSGAAYILFYASINFNVPDVS